MYYGEPAFLSFEPKNSNEIWGVLGADIYSRPLPHRDGVQAGNSALRLLHFSDSCFPALTGKHAVLPQNAEAIG